jgi:hypothetical protein
MTEIAETTSAVSISAFPPFSQREQVQNQSERVPGTIPSGRAIARVHIQPARIPAVSGARYDRRNNDEPDDPGASVNFCNWLLQVAGPRLLFTFGLCSLAAAYRL